MRPSSIPKVAMLISVGLHRSPHAGKSTSHLLAGLSTRINPQSHLNLAKYLATSRSNSLLYPSP